MKFSAFLKKRWFVILIALIVLVGGTVAAITLIGGQEDETLSDKTDDNGQEDMDSPKERIRLNLSALLSDKTGVKTESGFKLTFPKGAKLDAETVKEGFEVIPAFDFDMEKADDGFVIKPKAFLQANKVYTFKVNLPKQNIKESWAFQTRREFKAVSTLPGQKGTNVPLNSGIEITFSHTGIQDFEKNFSIEPKAEGRFEIHENIAVFVPKALKADTIYTVTVHKGVSQGDSKETLKDDVTFSFQTQSNIPGKNDNPSYLSVYNWLYNFPSDTQPVLEMSTSDDFKDREMEVSLYRYDTPEAFIKDYDGINHYPEWAVIDREQYIPDVSGLTPYKTYTLPLTNAPEYYYMTYLALPESLPEGHYLIIIKSDDLKEYAFIQINDMQLYMTVGDEKTLIWLNDMITGQPVSGAVFEGNGIKPVTTKDGTALIEEDIYKDQSGRTVCFKASREDHPALVAPVFNSVSYWTDKSQRTDYKSNWNYLYLDRSTYLPTDTVKVWGVLRPRSMEEPPQKVTVNLIKNLFDYKTYTYNKQVLDTREVVLTPKGTYTAQFSFENLPTDSYQIEVEDEGAVVSDSYFFVNKYVKSQYIVSAEAENKVYFAGETLKAKVGCEFFEGTPVPGFNLNWFAQNYSQYEKIGDGNLTLDSKGEGAISLVLPNENGPMSWEPVHHSLFIRNNDPEETEASDSEYFTVFPRDVMIQTDVDFKGGTANLSFKTNVVDLSAIRKTGEIYSGGDDPLYKGATIDRKLTATLYEHYWDKKETGEYYDMILKKSVKTYDYFEVKNALDDFEVQTSGGNADYTLSIPNYTSRKSYFIVYQTSDTKQRPIEETVYLYGDYYYWYGYGEDYYHLEFEDEENSYKVGEPVDFTLKKDGSDPIKGGNILYMVHQEGIKDYWTSQEVDQSHTFTEDYIPNVYIQAVYFDGRQLHTAYERLVKFDYSDKELDLTLETDKESYKPGEKVNATITVKDKAGNPVEADVSLSVVDEAYFALYEQEVGTSSSLYRSVYDSGIRSTYISYRKIIRGSGGAEGGEGGDEGGSGVRKNFVDSAFFEAAQTNSKGQAKLSFTLPDNLTSWRLTYQAVTDDLKAGNGQNNITTRLPFFVKTVLNDTFMLGDAPKLLLKGYGEKVKAQDEVTFKVTLKKVTLKNARGEIPVIEAKGKIGEFTEITLPNLDEEVYTVIVEGNSGGLRDAVEKTIQVRKSQLLAKQVDYHTLTKDLKLGIESYATLSFYNAELDDYYRSLTDLYWSFGSRLDQIVARNIAQELIKQYFPDDWYDGEKNDISSYQKEDGGFALLPYGSSEVELTAKIAALGVEGVDSDRLTDYFKGIISDPVTTPLQVSAAYWGLASLREPVLLELQGFMEEGDLTLDEKLYLANALAQLGDFASAEKLYEQITKAYGKDMAPYRYIEEGSGSTESILRWTSLTAMLAVNVDAKDKMAYFKYIEQVSSDELLINLERLILVKQGLPGAFSNKTSRFLLELDGKKETVKLEGTKPYTVMVSPDKLKSMKFSNIKGDVALSVSYEGAQDPSNHKNSIATVTRTYNGSEAFPVTLDRTDVVTVELRIDFSEAAPEGYYEVTDVLPSGLRYINPYQYTEGIYFGEPEGQRVKLGCYYDGTKDVETIKYRARVVAPGEYTADHALIKHSESDARGYSQKTSVKIK